MHMIQFQQTKAKRKCEIGFSNIWCGLAHKSKTCRKDSFVSSVPKRLSTSDSDPG